MNGTTTVLGAFLAALTLFGTALLALLTTEEITKVADITQVQWLVIGVGALISFAKDFQALTVRRALAKIPGVGSASSRPFVGFIVLLLSMLMLSGCAGTRSAYKAADGLSETAYVVGEHFYALVREANDLDDQGQVSSYQMGKIQDIARETRPTIVELLNTGAAYDAVKSAVEAVEATEARISDALVDEAFEAEANLSEALMDAALAVSRLAMAVKAAGGSVYIPRCMDVTSERALEYCALAA